MLLLLKCLPLSVQIIPMFKLTALKIEIPFWFSASTEQKPKLKMAEFILLGFSEHFEENDLMDLIHLYAGV